MYLTEMYVFALLKRMSYAFFFFGGGGGGGGDLCSNTVQ